MNERTVIRVSLGLVLIAVIFACHVSFRLSYASKNYDAFNTDEMNATFSDLMRYATYRYMPPSYESCINKLRQIDGATQQWALETHKQATDKPTWTELQPYFGRGHGVGIPRCPQGGLYNLASPAGQPTCTYHGDLLK